MNTIGFYSYWLRNKNLNNKEFVVNNSEIIYSLNNFIKKCVTSIVRHLKNYLIFFNCHCKNKLGALYYTKTNIYKQWHYIHTS